MISTVLGFTKIAFRSLHDHVGIDNDARPFLDRKGEKYVKRKSKQPHLAANSGTHAVGFVGCLWWWRWEHSFHSHRAGNTGLCPQPIPGGLPTGEKSWDELRECRGRVVAFRRSD